MPPIDDPVMINEWFVVARADDLADGAVMEARLLGETDEQIVARTDAVFAQDKRIVGTQRPCEIPLDLREELHVRSDKYCVACRKWLRDIGVR